MKCIMHRGYSLAASVLIQDTKSGSVAAALQRRFASNQGMADETTESTPKEEPKSISVYDMVAGVAEQMAMIAWQKLGLQPDMMTGKMEMNLEEAKVAIDVTTQL